jgi:glycosyltransferase involved in cell wall biosynthesis
MEAQSGGIPVIATDVGGTSEIVNNENGLLLEADPDPDEIAKTLYEVFRNKTGWRTKRQLSYDNWLRNFNADINYKLFTEELISLTV